MRSHHLPARHLMHEPSYICKEVKNVQDPLFICFVACTDIGKKCFRHAAILLTRHLHHGELKEIGSTNILHLFAALQITFPLVCASHAPTVAIRFRSQFHSCFEHPSSCHWLQQHHASHSFLIIDSRTVIVRARHHFSQSQRVRNVKMEWNR